jgi:type II secretion system protein N
MALALPSWANPSAIPQRFRKPLMWAGWVFFALGVSLITVFASLPRDRIKDRIETVLSADPSSMQPGALGMDVQIGDLSLTLFTGAGLRAKDVVLRTRPLKEGDKPARYLVDDLTVHVGLLGLLFNRPTYKFKAHGLSGSVTGEISISPSEQRIKIDADGLVLTGVPGIAQSVGLPVEGTLSFKVDAVAAKSMASNMDGTAEITIDGAVIGDGKAKLTVPGDPFLAQGLTFPKLRLGTVSGKVSMVKGRANIDDFRIHSADGDATLEGYVELRDPFSSSLMHGFLKFRPSEALVKREPTVELMNNALATAKRSDGYMGFQLSGPLTAVYYMPNQNPPPGVVSKGGSSTGPAPGGPTLTPPVPPPPANTLPPPSGSTPPPAEPAGEPTPSQPPIPIPPSGVPPPTTAGPGAIPIGGSPPGTGGAPQGQSVSAPPANPRGLIPRPPEEPAAGENPPAKGNEQ